MLHRDNYGEPVPARLVVIDFIPEDDADGRLVMGCKWWEVDGHPGILLASGDILESLYGAGPKDAGIDLDGEDGAAAIRRIPDSLKRIDDDGTLYHA